MKIYETVLALTLVLTYLRATVRAIEAPKPSNPSKYATDKIDTSSEPLTAYSNGSFSMTVDDKGMITSMTNNQPFITTTTLASKYTPEQLQSMYKINPYTNKPYKL